MVVRNLAPLFNGTYDYPGVPSKKHPGGKTYRVPSPDAITGAQMTYQAAIGMKIGRGEDITSDEREAVALDDAAEEDFYKDILGPVYDEMIADGVSWALLQACATDAYMCITGNEELADFTLAAAAADKAGDGEGEAEARPNRAARRAPAKRTASKTAGSKSNRASTATPVRTRSQGSTPSSRSRAVKTG